MPDPTTAEPANRSMWTLLKETFSDFMEDKAMQQAAALAFYTIFSLGPVLIIVISIAGLIWGEEAARGELVDQFRGIAGDAGAQQIEQIIQNAGQRGKGVLASIIGIATLIIGATGVFGQLKDSLNTIWEVQPKPGRAIVGLLTNRLLSFGMVLAIAFLLMATLVGSAVISALGKFMGEYLPVPEGAMYALDLILSAGLITVLFAAIFKWLPDVKIGWRDVWLGAFVTALLFAVGKFALGLYLGRSSVASVYGAAGSLIVILLWVYYSAIIFLFGAEFTQVYARLHGKKIEPAEHAMFIGAECLEPSDAHRRTPRSHRQPQRPRDVRNQPAVVGFRQSPGDRLIEQVSQPIADYVIDVISTRLSRIGRSRISPSRETKSSPRVPVEDPRIHRVP